MQEDADLDGAPTDEEEDHHHHHHAGDSRPHRCCSFCLSLELELGRNCNVVAVIKKHELFSVDLLGEFTIVLLLGSCCRWDSHWVVPSA